jgi:murein DD-endopeptidase MepM/ murein hydrolase activator NlpD
MKKRYLFLIVVAFICSLAPSIFAQVGDLKGSLSTNGIKEKGAEEVATQGDFGCRPVKGGRITSRYGPRKIFGQKFHHGIDISVPNGTKAYAIGDGVVTKVGYNAGGGRFMDIKYSNGYTSRYYHLKSTVPKKGARVKMGDLVAYTNNTGSWTTGPHLHFEFRNPSGKMVDPEKIPGMEI